MKKRVWVVRLESGTELVEPLVFSTAEKAYQWIVDELCGDSDWTEEERVRAMSDLTQSFVENKNKFCIEFYAYCESHVLDKYESTHFNI